MTGRRFTRALATRLRGERRRVVRDDWRRKPAYFGMRAALLEAVLRCGA